MSLVDAAMYTLHLLFAALWTGSVLFVTYAIVGLARDANLNAAPLGTIAGKLTTISRASALVLFVTGGHMAATGYTVDSLLGSPRGHLVLTMLVLWFVLAGLVEVGASKLSDGTDRDKVREPARDATPFFRGAAVVAVLLLLDAGALIAANFGYLPL